MRRDGVHLEESDDLAEAHQGHGEEAAHPGVGSCLAKDGVDAPVDVEVGGVHGAALGDGAAGQALAHGHPGLGHLGADGRVRRGHVHLPVLHEQDRAAPEVHERPHGAEHRLQDGLQLEGGPDFARHVGEQLL